MKIQAPKPLRSEDFKPEEKELIDKLSTSINPFNDDLYRVLNGGIDYTNMNRQLIENVIVVIDSAGNVVNSPQIKHRLNGRVKGLVVVYAQNQTNTTVYPTNTPFISFSLDKDLVKILSITGLQNSSRYSLNIEIMA